MRNRKTVKAAKLGYIVTSLFLCGVGVVLMAWPKFSVKMLCQMTGTMLIVCGAIKLVGYFSRDLYRLAFQFDLAFGLLSVAMGFLLLFHAEGVIWVLHVIIGVIALTDGLFKLQTALDARRFGLDRWWMIASTAVISALCGLLLVADPFAGAAALMAVTGLTFFAEGVLNLCVALCTVKIIESKKEENG
ncbi:MAG: hypothetical protein HFI67_10160 [Lachnospiraceae bacterium]|jgi:uncharacterized membrane protein HdeD (DUF308 family)|nr:hypothetical protein [Lachnospiraceae bacterium]